MPEYFDDVAHVTMDTWTGSFAGDEAGLEHLETFLSVNADDWYLVRVEMSLSGGTQWVTGYAVPMEEGVVPLLVARAERGEVIELTKVVHIRRETPGHSDFNPPPPPSLPIKSATQLLEHGFKRWQLILTRRELSFPPGATFEIIELES